MSRQQIFSKKPNQFNCRAGLSFTQSQREKCRDIRPAHPAQSPPPNHHQPPPSQQPHSTVPHPACHLTLPSLPTLPACLPRLPCLIFYTHCLIFYLPVKYSTHTPSNILCTQLILYIAPSIFSITHLIFYVTPSIFYVNLACDALETRLALPLPPGVVNCWVECPLLVMSKHALPSSVRWRYQHTAKDLRLCGELWKLLSETSKCCWHLEPFLPCAHSISHHTAPAAWHTSVTSYIKLVDCKHFLSIVLARKTLETLKECYLYMYMKPFSSAEWWTFFSQWLKFHFPIFLLSLPKPKLLICSVSVY